MITINRDEFRKLLAGQYAVTNQTYSKLECEKFIESGMWTYDLLVRSFNKIDIKSTTDKLSTTEEQTNDGQTTN